MSEALISSLISSLKMKVDRLHHRASYWKKKSEELTDLFDDNVTDVILTREEEKEKLKGEVEHLEHENNDLCDVVDDILDETKGIVCFENGKYTDDVRACCYELLSLNVGMRNVKPVIKSVLLNIAHQEVDRLPGKTTLCDMISLAQAQLSEELSQQGGDFYTLQTDGTTKHGQHFGTYDIATVNATYCLGLCHIFSGSAQLKHTRNFKRNIG